MTADRPTQLPTDPPEAPGRPTHPIADPPGVVKPDHDLPRGPGRPGHDLPETPEKPGQKPGDKPRSK